MFTYVSHTVALCLMVLPMIRLYSVITNSLLLASSVLIGDLYLNLQLLTILLRSSLCRYSIITMKIRNARNTKTKAKVITNGESKSSSNSNVVTRMINYKIMPSYLLRISLLYGLINRCIKAIIPQTAMSKYLATRSLDESAMTIVMITS